MDETSPGHGQFLRRLRGWREHGAARQREVASSFNRFKKFPRVLLSEDAWFRRSAQVERSQVGQLKVEDIQGFVNETTLNQLVGDDPTKCVELETLSCRSTQGGGSSGRDIADFRIPKLRIVDLW